MLTRISISMAQHSCYILLDCCDQPLPSAPQSWEAPKTGRTWLAWWISYLHLCQPSLVFSNQLLDVGGKIKDTNQIHLVSIPFRKHPIYKAAFGITDYFIPSQNVPHRGYSQQCLHKSKQFLDQMEIFKKHILSFPNLTVIFCFYFHVTCPCEKWKSVSHSVMSDSLWTHEPQPTRLLCPWDSPGKNTRVGCHFLLQGIFPMQGLNPRFPHCRQILYC